MAADEAPTPAVWRQASYLALAGTALAIGLGAALPGSAGTVLLLVSALCAMVLTAWRGTLVLAGAQFCYCGTILYDFIVPWLTGDALPDGDFPFLAVALGNATAVVLLSRTPAAPGAQRTPITDVLIIGTGTAVLGWLFLFKELSDDSALSLPRQLAVIAHPGLDVFLVLLVLRLVFTGRARNPAKLFLLAWAGLQLAGSITHTIQELRGTWTVDSPVFLLWIAAAGCLAAAVVHPAMSRLTIPPSTRGPVARRTIRALVVAAELVLPAVLLVRVFQRNSDDLAVITGATVLIFVLVLMRGGTFGDRRSTRSDRIAGLRMVAVFVVAALLPLGLMAESSIRLAEKVVTKDARDRVSTTSVVSAQLVQQQMAGLRKLVGSYAERRLLAAALGDGTYATMDTTAVERHLRQLQAADSGLVSVFVTDAAGRLGDVNPRTAAFEAGADRSGQNWYSGVRATGRSYISQAYTTFSDGDETRAVVAATPVHRVADDRILGYLGAVYDLRAIQAFAVDLAKAQGVSLRITDQRGMVVAAPGTDVSSMTDASQETGVAQALQGQAGLGTTRAPDGEEILSAYAPVSGLGWTVTAQVPTATAYASLAELRSTVLAVAVLLGQVLMGGLLIMVRVQRRHQEAERSLQERERSTSAILEAAGDAFVSIDENDVIIAWSRQAELLFGWSSAEAQGAVLTDLIVPPSLKQRHSKGVRRLVDTGVPRILGQRLELSAMHRDGHEFPIELALWQSESDGNRSFNAFIHDITTRKQHEAALAEARDRALETSRLKTEFLAVMSHELRTPMNGVMGMTSLLLGTQLSQQQREYAETVRSSADSLLELLNDILDLSKVEADRLELEVLDFDLHQVVRDIVHLLQVAAQQKGITLTATIADDVHRALRGDPGRLRQVLVNLVGNAIKFTAEGSVTLRVLTDRAASASADGPVCLRFEVIDTGIGIAPEARARVFESFSQADASTTRQYGGTGLGLAISQKLVALFEGEIGVESELGAGSTFWFTARFQRGEPVEPPAEDLDSSEPGPAASPGLVLVVDDNATNQKIAVRMLERLGHRADVAADGAEAVSAWAAVPYDLILMDCRMPVMDGYEATRTIRGTEGSGRRTPIVAMTASAMVDDRERCLEAGMDDFLSKPVQLNQLRDKVNHWLARPTAVEAPAVPAPRTEDGPPVLDQEIITELSSYGSEFIVSLIEDFLAAAPDRVARIRATAEEGDAEEVARAAHALRGAAANLGGARLAHVCAQIEEAGQNGRPEEAVVLLPALDTEAESLRQAMRAVTEVAV
ncbi:ATP-binding protein [Kineosporia rhizophila]|uniref:response regulator n=1 Tax=Kineosporia rhizophila TaxID=84633 RepID=UPI001E3332E5|nr:ATP-binding protein [Kineosporia rhizophila]